MIAGTLSFTSILLCLISTIPATATQGRVPDGLTAFAERTAADVGASSLNIPQFESAKVDGLEDLGKANGIDRYLCWLKTDPNRVGYIAVAHTDESFQVLAFSATTLPPQYFLNDLQVPHAQKESLDFAHVNQVAAVADVPLVAATKTYLLGEPFEISELAASVSAVLNHCQTKREILLLRHAGLQRGGPQMSGPDSEYTRRYRENPASAQAPTDPNWQSFRTERNAALASAGLKPGRTHEKSVARKLRTWDIIKPLVKRRLLDPVNARERFDVIQEEGIALDAVVVPGVSLSMKDAVLLQTHYLDGARRNLQRDIESFFWTRGRTVRLESPPFEKMATDALPVLILGPEDLAAVVLGYVDIGGQRFASVLLPATARPIVTSLAQWGREYRMAQGLPPETNRTEGEEFDRAVARMRAAEEEKRRMCEAQGIPYQPPEKDPAQVLKESVERMRAGNEALPVAEDRFSVSPMNLEHGVHLIRCSALRSWQTLYIADIGVADNWGEDGVGRGNSPWDRHGRGGRAGGVSRVGASGLRRERGARLWLCTS